MSVPQHIMKDQPRDNKVLKYILNFLFPMIELNEVSLTIDLETNILKAMVMTNNYKAPLL